MEFESSGILQSVLLGLFREPQKSLETTIESISRRMISNFTVFFSWLSVRKAFQQILLEIYDICPYISLKLPASSRYVNQQIQRLNLAQQQLQMIEEKVFLCFGTGSNQSSRQAYQTLAELIEEMNQLSLNLKLLAEEYPVDPAGTVAFLPSARVRVSELLSRINRLKAAEQGKAKKSSKISFNPHLLQLTSNLGITCADSQSESSRTFAAWKRQSQGNNAYSQHTFWTPELAIAQLKSVNKDKSLR